MNYMELKQNRSDSVYSEILMVDRQYALGDIARLFQRITENAMDKLGTGYYQLKEKELIWVICFSDIRIKRMPAEGETIEIYSWPGKDRFGMYSRKYAMYTGDGESLITCASLFSIVDQNTRKMIASGDAGFSFPVVEFADEPPLPKMNEKGGVTSQVQQHAVSVHEIDKNDHVNNSFYLDWAENLLGDCADKQLAAIKRVWISYAREIRMGETVVFQYGSEKDTLFVKGKVGDDNCFKVLLSA